jgi:glutamate/tyrosine decarboxylase-like PLP-dependent enzyme
MNVSPGVGPLHGADAVPGSLGERVRAHIEARIAKAPLGRTVPPHVMEPLLEGAITPTGLGVDTAWQLYLDHVEPNTVGLDSERFLAFIPVSPSAAGVWMDAMVGAATFSAESWLEASGVVAAENQTLRWLADLMGLPSSAGGCFMSGGSIGNLSALAVARESARRGRVVAVGDTAHASVGNALRLLGLDDVIVVPTGSAGRLTGEALRAALDADPERASRLGVVVAAGGSTNAGIVDDLSGLADECEQRGAWLHVDAAYGGAALVLPEKRALFAGLERADSVIVDPHKWLFAPEGSCALLYRNPGLAAAVHTQHGPYIDSLHSGDDLWNPSDYGFQLTRRATGLPLWFQLVVHGTDALTEAVRVGVRLAALAAERLAATPDVSLVLQPELGVVLFRREGWGRSEWADWARRVLDDGVAFVAPSTWKGEPVGRLVFMHPRTPATVIDEIIGTLA